MIAPEKRSSPVAPAIEFRRMRVHQPTTPQRNAVDEFLGKYALALGAAGLVMGVLIGWFVKRR